MTSSDLKYFVEQKNHEPFFFTRKTMKFFGDTMRNYGVRSSLITRNISGPYSGAVECWELYRRKPVKHGLIDSAYFCKTTGKRIYQRRTV